MNRKLSFREFIEKLFVEDDFEGSFLSWYYLLKPCSQTGTFTTVFLILRGQHQSMKQSNLELRAITNWVSSIWCRHASSRLKLKVDNTRKGARSAQIRISNTWVSNQNKRQYHGRYAVFQFCHGAVEVSSVNIGPGTVTCCYLQYKENIPPLSS